MKKLLMHGVFLLLACRNGVGDATAASGAEFPERPVRIIVGVSPGGSGDRVARQLAAGLSRKWGQAVVVENRPGGDGVIALTHVARATPDGHTLFLSGNAHTAAAMDKRLPFHPVNDFTAITRLGVFSSVLIVPAALAVKTVKELVAMAKVKPGQLNFSSTGGGSPSYLQMMALLEQTGIKMTDVTYKGGGDAVLAVIRGEVHATTAAVATVKGPIQGGLVNALAVTTHARTSALPDVPTIAESLEMPGYRGVEVWNGIVGPRGVPSNIVKAVHDAVIEVAKTGEFLKVNEGFVVVGSSPNGFRNFLVEELARLAAHSKK